MQNILDILIQLLHMHQSNSWRILYDNGTKPVNNTAMVAEYGEDELDASNTAPTQAAAIEHLQRVMNMLQPGRYIFQHWKGRKQAGRYFYNFSTLPQQAPFIGGGFGNMPQGVGYPAPNGMVTAREMELALLNKEKEFAIEGIRKEMQQMREENTSRWDKALDKILEHPQLGDIINGLLGMFSPRAQIGYTGVQAPLIPPRVQPTPPAPVTNPNPDDAMTLEEQEMTEHITAFMARVKELNGGSDLEASRFLKRLANFSITQEGTFLSLKPMIDSQPLILKTT